MGLVNSSEHEYLKELLSDENQYSFEVEKGVYRNVAVKDTGLWKYIPNTNDSPTLWEVFNHIVDSGPNELMYGERIANADGSLGDFDFMTRKQSSDRVSLIIGGLKQKFPYLKKGSKIGIYGKNCTDFVLIAAACWNQGWIVVPIYDTFGPESVQYVVNHSEMDLVICTEENLTKVPAFLNEESTVKGIVTFTKRTELMVNRNNPLKEDSHIPIKELTVKDIELPIVSLESLVLANYRHEMSQGDAVADDIAFIMYSSGTTGTPKGVIQTQGGYVAAIAGFSGELSELGETLGREMSLLSYLPLAHAYEYVIQLFIMANGGRIGFYSGNIRELVNDIRVLKPTVFGGVPRVFQRMEQVINQQIAAKPTLLRMLINRAMAVQTDAVLRRKARSTLYDILVFNKMKQAFGGNVKYMVSGSAPISPALITFMRVCLDVKFIEGYGLTETLACHSVMEPRDKTCGSIGAQCYCAESKLVDVLELDYSTVDKYPRGELCIRGNHLFKGYYKNPEMTAEVLDEDGWFHTGDIARMNPNGTISIIDRKKNIFKLAQGEYVAAEKIENVLLRSDLVGQIFVHGDSFQNYLVAIVTPEPTTFIPACKKLGLDVIPFKEEGWKQRFQELCNDTRCKKMIVDDLTQLATASKLMRFEFVKKVYLEGKINDMNQGFSVENNLLTATFKSKRPQLKKHYRDEIDEMYSL